MRLLSLLVGSAVLLASAQAGSVVIPNANASANGSSEQFIPFGENGTTFEFQWAINASQLGTMSGNLVTGIGFRLAAGQSSVGASMMNTFDLQLSSSNNPIGALSTTYANNIGANVVTVYNSSLSLPGLTGGAGPNPFFLINFTTPYLYAGGDLLVTLISSSNSSFAVDANHVDSLVDTVGNPQGPTGLAEFYNYPITEFQFTSAAPEPASVGLLIAGLASLGVIRRFSKSGWRSR
jgi:hypothetical protein